MTNGTTANPRTEARPSNDDPGPVFDYCPTWCIEESQQVTEAIGRVGALRVPNELHNVEWHTSHSTGVDIRARTSPFYVRLVERNTHGWAREKLPPDASITYVELSDGADEDTVIFRLLSGEARALAAQLVYHCDKTEGLL